MDLLTAVCVGSPLLGLASAVAAHVVISRIQPASLRHHVIAASMGIGLSVVSALSLTFAWREPAIVPAAERWIAAATWVFAYVCLAYAYVFGFFNPSETARRMRLVVELHDAGPRGLRLDEILAAYNARMVVDIRVGRLVAGGQLVVRGDRYVIGAPAMLYLAKLFVLLKVIFFGVPSEFERPRASARSDRQGAR